MLNKILYNILHLSICTLSMHVIVFVYLNTAQKSIGLIIFKYNFGPTHLSLP